MITHTSETFLRDVAHILETHKGRFAETPMGAFYRGPDGAFIHKTLFVGAGETIPERRQSCLDVAQFFRKEQIMVRHELLDEHGALIIDAPTAAQIERLHRYSPTMVDGE